MEKCFVNYFLTKITPLLLAAAVPLLAPALAQANTSWVHGGNWAATDGLVTNVIAYPDGLTSSSSPTDTTNVAKTVAFDYKAVGINFVRYPINPATVSGNWAVTQAAIDELIAQGLDVDICCWYVNPQPQGGNGEIPNMNTWSNMWKTVDGVYGNNTSVYYEPINEPSGYSLSGLEGVYADFLGYGLKKGQGYFLLGGLGYEDDVTGIGADPTFNSCLLAVHDYSSWATYTTVSAWETQLAGEVGSYGSRTVMTEMGANTTLGLDYLDSSSDSNVCFVQGMCAECDSVGMGFTWFPAHQAGTNDKRMFNNPGQGVVNPTLVMELQSGWGLSFSWYPWDNPASGSGFTTAFAACSYGSLREDLFGIKSDGNIYHTFIQNNLSEGWNTTWEEHQCPVAPAGAPPASANNGVAGRMDLYYIGTDGNLYHQYFTNSWQPSLNTWINIGAPSGVTLVGSPAATSWAAGRYDIYARASSHAIYHAWSTDGTNWSWQDNGGSVTNDVTACSWGANRLDGFALGTGNGQIWHQYWDGSWNPSQSTWEQDLPETNCEYALGACSWATNRTDLFCNEHGSTIGHVWCPLGDTWSGDWTQTFTPPAAPVSAPCATSWGVNRVDVFVLGSDGKCYHLYWGL